MFNVVAGCSVNTVVRLCRFYKLGFYMTAIDDALLHSQRWGRQTILFAFCVRDHSDGQSRDDPSQIKHAMTTADDVAEQLWKQATSNDIPNHQIPLVFSKLVFDWVSNHLTLS